jgi:hypothetical protein
LNLNNTLAAATKVQLNLINTGGGAGAGSAIDFYTYLLSVASANAEARIAAIDNGGYSAYLSLQTKTSGSTGTNGLVERVKIDDTFGLSAVGSIACNNFYGSSTSVTGATTAASIFASSSSGQTSLGTDSGGSISIGFQANRASATSPYIDFNSSSVYVDYDARIFVSGNTGTVAGGTLTISAATVAASALFSAAGNVVGANILTAGLISSTGNITGGNLSVGTGTITVGNIVNSNGNAVGNIGSSSNYFNTVFAKATSAQYADLAETYVADDSYTPGTLVIFGGADEITASTVSHDTRVAGVISTAPAYLMNSGIVGLPVALTGRVPCSVVGTIRKGDRLVASDIKGVATALDSNKYLPGCIIGKSLEDYNSNSPGVIEVAIGRY